MNQGTSVRLLVNEDYGHGDVIGKMLKKAERLECMVAFAKASALHALINPLRRALESGLDARFAIGLDFYLTEPAVLRELLSLAEKHKLELYLSDSNDTFHPKIYAFRHGKGCSVIVGSANFTQGGLYGNYEASAVIKDEEGSLMTSVARHFDALIVGEVLVRATKDRIDAYEREYVIQDICRKVARKRAMKASHADGPNLAVLADLLALMRDDDSEFGFSKQEAMRKANLCRARRLLEDWVTVRGDRSRGFVGRFESLIELFHSGGLHRGKNRIAQHPGQFVAAVADIMGRRDLPPAEAFAVLHEHFKEIPRAGINLLTEILHTLNSEQYAVMNQNAVSGLALAGISGFPSRPNKRNVGADDYARYCRHADKVRNGLGLGDFTELDALFNYAYWRQFPGDESAG